MKRAAFAPWMFGTSGAINVGGAGGAWLAREPLFAWLGLPYPEPAVFLHGLLALVFVFGLSYLWIARDPARSLELIALGLVGKAFMVATYGSLFATCEVHPFFWAPLAIDLGFALLYAEFLWKETHRER